MPPSSPAEPEQDEDERDQSLTLDVLRQLVRKDWARLPGKTLVVLCRDASGNGYSPFSTYNVNRLALFTGGAVSCSRVWEAPRSTGG